MRPRHLAKTFSEPTKMNGDCQSFLESGKGQNGKVLAKRLGLSVSPGLVVNTLRVEQRRMKALLQFRGIGSTQARPARPPRSVTRPVR